MTISPEPSVDFDWAAIDDSESLDRTATIEGRNQGFCAALAILSDCRGATALQLRYEALRHLVQPRTETVCSIARRLGCSRKTVHLEIRRLKSRLPTVTTLTDGYTPSL